MNSNPTQVSLDDFILNAPKGVIYTYADDPEVTLSYVNGRFVYRRAHYHDPEDMQGAWRMLKFDRAMYNRHKALLKSYGFEVDSDDFNTCYGFILSNHTQIRRP